MTFAQWIIDKTEPGMLAAIAVLDPIHGSGSLQLGRGTATGSNVSICVSPGPTLPQAFEGGRCRHLWRVDAHSSSFRDHIGLLCMKSQRDLTAGAGSAYALVGRITSSDGRIETLRLQKYTAGITELGEILAGLSIPSVTPGTVLALELEWLVDLEALGGVRLIGRYGADFDSLTEAFTIVDTTDPLTETTGEGPFIYIHFSSTPMTVSLDRTRHRRVLSTSL